MILIVTMLISIFNAMMLVFILEQVFDIKMEVMYLYEKEIGNEDKNTTD